MALRDCSTRPAEKLGFFATRVKSWFCLAPCAAEKENVACRSCGVPSAPPQDVQGLVCPTLPTAKGKCMDSVNTASVLDTQEKFSAQGYALPSAVGASPVIQGETRQHLEGSSNVEPVPPVVKGETRQPLEGTANVESAPPPTNGGSFSDPSWSSAESEGVKPRPLNIHSLKSPIPLKVEWLPEPASSSPSVSQYSGTSSRYGGSARLAGRRYGGSCHDSADSYRHFNKHRNGTSMKGSSLVKSGCEPALNIPAD